MISDKEFICPCGQTFTWTRGEQEFMEGLKRDGKVKEVHEPKHCPDCRAKRKRQKEENKY